MSVPVNIFYMIEEQISDMINKNNIPINDNFKYIPSITIVNNVCEVRVKEDTMDKDSYRCDIVTLSNHIESIGKYRYINNRTYGRDRLVYNKPIERVFIDRYDGYHICLIIKPNSDWDIMSGNTNFERLTISAILFTNLIENKDYMKFKVLKEV